jgi:HEAT repeat protein
MVLRRLLAALSRRHSGAEPGDEDEVIARSADEIEAAIKALRDPAEQAHRDADVALAGLGLSQAFLPALLRLMRDDDAYLREAAVHALGHYPLDEHWRLRTAVLARLRRDPSSAVRAAAAAALSRCATRCVRALRRALEDAEPDVRLAAIGALENADHEHALAAVAYRLLNDAEPDVRIRAAKALGQSEDTGWLEALVRAFGDSNEAVRAEAIYRASMCSTEDEVRASLTPDLLRMLNDASARVRAEACKALFYGSPDAVAPLVRALGDPDADVRRHAAQSLGVHQALETVDALAAALCADVDTRVREAAATALGLIGGERAAHALIHAEPERPESTDLRAMRLEAMGNTLHESVLAPLREALADTAADIRRAAASALQRLAAFGKLSPDAIAATVPPLCTAALAPDASVRKDAIEALRSFAHPGALPALMQLASQRDEETRAAAHKALGAFGGAEVEAQLVRGLRDRSLAVQVAAAQGLAHLRPLTRWQELLPKLRHSHTSGEVRAALAEALAQVGTPEALAALEAVMRDPDDWLRRKVCEALLEVECPQLIPGLLDLLDDEEEGVRAAAALAIGAVDDPRGFEALKERLSREPEPYVRRRLVWAISFFAPDDCVPLLTAHLQDEGEHVREQAARALGELLDADALHELMRRLPRRTPADVRSTLAEAAHPGEDGERPLWHRQHRWLRMGTVHYE